jgi:uncharacterized protein (DUF4415 family)
MSKAPQRKAGKSTGKSIVKSATRSTAKSKTQAGTTPRKTRTPPAATSEWASGVVFNVKEPKLAVSLRLDADVLRFFRGFGSGYQTRINEVLRVFMDAHTPAAPPNGGRPAARARR